MMLLLLVLLFSTLSLFLLFCCSSATDRVPESNPFATSDKHWRVRGPHVGGSGWPNTSNTRPPGCPQRVHWVSLSFFSFFFLPSLLPLFLGNVFHTPSLHELICVENPPKCGTISFVFVFRFRFFVIYGHLSLPRLLFPPPQSAEKIEARGARRTRFVFPWPTNRCLQNKQGYIHQAKGWPFLLLLSKGSSFVGTD